MLRLLQIASLLLAVSSTGLAQTSPNYSCGEKSGYTCPSGYCCSEFGWCGKGSDYCSSGCQPNWGVCSGGSSSGGSSSGGSSSHGGTSGGSSKVSVDGKCSNNGRTCDGYKDGSCCSQWGYCGDSEPYCGKGCQESFGSCHELSKPSSTKASVKPITKTSSLKPSYIRTSRKPASTKSLKLYTKSNGKTSSKTTTISVTSSASSSEIVSSSTSSAVASSTDSSSSISSSAATSSSATSSIVAQPSSCGILPNAGFEDDPNTAWMASSFGPGGYIIPFTDNLAIEGTRVAYIIVDGPGVVVTLTNTITNLTPGLFYTVNFSTHRAVDIIASASIDSQTYITVPVSVSFDWVASTFIFQASSTTAQLKLILSNAGDGTTANLVDAVSVDCGSVVPPISSTSSSISASASETSSSASSFPIQSST